MPQNCRAFIFSWPWRNCCGWLWPNVAPCLNWCSSAPEIPALEQLRCTGMHRVHQQQSQKYCTAPFKYWHHLQFHNWGHICSNPNSDCSALPGMHKHILTPKWEKRFAMSPQIIAPLFLHSFLHLVVSLAEAQEQCVKAKGNKHHGGDEVWHRDGIVVSEYGL